MSFPSWPAKDPDERLDYSIDWSKRLGTDRITTSTWTVPTGITQDGALNTSKVATIWLIGGTLDQTYEITNRITTAGERTMEQTVKISIKRK